METIVADGPNGVPSSAPPVLYEDLLRLVFEHFDCETDEGSATCASCALVCRAWTEPSAKVLWRSLRSGWKDALSPLYNILHPVGKSTVHDSAGYYTEASLIDSLTLMLWLISVADLVGKAIYRSQALGTLPAALLLCL